MTRTEPMSIGQHNFIRKLEREKGQDRKDLTGWNSGEAWDYTEALKRLPDVVTNPALKPKVVDNPHLVVTNTKTEYNPAKIGMCEKIVLEQGNVKFYIDNPEKFAQEVLFLLQLCDKAEKVIA